MTMGCKYHVLSVQTPYELLSVCLNHLDALRKIVQNNIEVTKLIENAHNKLVQVRKYTLSGLPATCLFICVSCY